MNSRSASKIKLAKFDDLFGINDESEDRVIEVTISMLHSFKDHPFHVEDDSQMEEMVESIKEYGVLVPGLARLRDNGEYELISGHRRRHACELAGKETMPVIVKNMTEDEATIAMVDSNIQRENLLYSEKAFALKLKFEAMKHQGLKGTMNTTDMIGESIGESGRQVQRYIRLTYLHPEILKMVDNKKISFIPAVNLSYLKKDEQELLLKTISKKKVYPTGRQALRLKEHSLKETLTEDIINSVLFKKKTQNIKLNIPLDKLTKYFPTEYTNQDIVNAIIKLLDENLNNGGSY